MCVFVCFACCRSFLTFTSVHQLLAAFHRLHSLRSVYYWRRITMGSWKIWVPLSWHFFHIYPICFIIYLLIYLLLFLFIYLFIHFWYRTERICRWLIQNQHYFFSFFFLVKELNKLRNVTEVFVLCLCCAVVHLLLILIASPNVSKYCLVRRVSKSVDIKFVMQVEWASYGLYCKLV